MPLGLLTSSLIPPLSGLLGGANGTPAAQPSQPAAPKPPLGDVSKDRLDLTGAADPAKEPALPVAAYAPPVAQSTAPQPAQAEAAAQPPAEGPALPVTPAQIMADARARDEAAAPPPAVRASTGAPVTTEAGNDTAPIRAAGGTVVEPISLWSDEDRARAMAIKALDHERRINMAGQLTEAAQKTVVAQGQQAAARASAEAGTASRPALLVA